MHTPQLTEMLLNNIQDII